MDPSPNDTPPKCAPALWSWTRQSQESITQLPGCTSSGRDILGKLWLLHWGHEPPKVVKVPSSPWWLMVSGRAASNAWCNPAKAALDDRAWERGTHSQCVQMGFINQAPTAPLH